MQGPPNGRSGQGADGPSGRSADGPSDRGARVLVIEDEDPYKYYLTQALRDDGCEVVDLADEGGIDAALATFTPDVLLVDWMLRGAGDGLEIARDLKQRLPHLRVVLISGYPADAVRRADRSGLGPLWFLPKPFDEDDVLAAVQGRAQGAVLRLEEGDGPDDGPSGEENAQ